jgi:hypothetical protein
VKHLIIIESSLMGTIIIGHISVFIYLFCAFASNMVDKISESMVWNLLLILSSNEYDSSIHQDLSYFK